MVKHIKVGDVVILRDDGCEYDVVAFNTGRDRVFLRNKYALFSRKTVVVHEKELHSRLKLPGRE